METGRTRGIGILVVALGAATLAPSTAEAAPPTLAASETRPMHGEKFTLRADLPGSGKKTIRLQRKAGGRWVTVAKKRSNRKVAASFTHRTSKPVTLRAVAGTGKKRHVSRRVTVRPVAQAARLVLPQRASAGESLRAAASFSPARRGRLVSFQQHSAGTWRTVAQARQDRNGLAVATLRPSTSTRYRVATGVHRGAARHTSAPVTVTVTKTATPPPTPPGLRCDLPPDGTVTWGSGGTTHPSREVARLEVTTDDGLPVTSKTDYSHASVVLSEPGAEPVTLGARLRVRGNTTALVHMKLPYRFKLDSATSLRGMPRSKEWVLLANFFDRSMLRNDTAFELSRRLGAQWTPRMQPVELWLNGAYKGLYQLGEKIEVEPDRVALPDGAVLLEADSYTDTDPSFVTARGLQVFTKSTDDQAVADRVGDQVRRIEDVLYSDHYRDPRYGYRACIDVDSFVNAYLLAETTKNIDSAFQNSVWMVLGADGRLAMGPAWDFDMGTGNRHNCDIANPQGWFVNRNWASEQPQTPSCFPTQLRGPEGHWYERLMSDPWFVDKVRARWAQVRGSMLTLPDHVDASAAQVSEAAKRNFASTADGGAGLPLGPTLIEDPKNHVFRGSWSAEAEALSTWLDDRIAWLDAQFG